MGYFTFIMKYCYKYKILVEFHNYFKTFRLELFKKVFGVQFSHLIVHWAIIQIIKFSNSLIQFRENCSIKKSHMNTFVHSNKSWIFSILWKSRNSMDAKLFQHIQNIKVSISDIPGRPPSIHFHKMISQKNYIHI